MADPSEAWLPPGLALVFDMDGVIVDSNPLHREAWKLYTCRVGLETREAIADRMYGKRNDDIVRDVFGSTLTAEQVAAHGAAKEALYREMTGPKLAEILTPGVREFLRRHAGVPMGVATNAEPANVDFVLDGSGLRRYFPVVVDGHQVRHSKPHPEVYLRAAQLLSVEPRNCIVFEDSFAGIEAARAAGTRVVGITTTHATLPGTSLAIGDFRAPELEPWLREQRLRIS